ncbi:hypothetical protein TWF718_009054 [Orbilia javanica]|uniref:Uncharacterized protein n=1 Tax=Orbilia javanica TaxID=47235 RepID=A0AAN8MLN4_9PEZI
MTSKKNKRKQRRMRLTPSEENYNAYWGKKTDRYGNPIPKVRNKPNIITVPTNASSRKKPTMDQSCKPGGSQPGVDEFDERPGWEFGRPCGLRVEPEPKPRYDPVADLNRIIEKGRREVEALRHTIEAKRAYGENTGRLPGLTDELSQKMTELELYNTSEEARMNHAWGMAREHDNKVRERAAKCGKENSSRVAEVPLQYRCARSFWSHEKKERDMVIDVAARIIREEAFTRRRREVAPIAAICQRTRYLSTGQRNQIGGWVLDLPEEFEEGGGPAPVPTYG